MDENFTSALWTSLHQSFGTKVSLSTAYHPQPDGLAERMIQTLDDMVRRIFAYGLEFKEYKRDKSHATPDFKVGDLVLVSSNNFNNNKGCKNLKYSFAGPFAIEALHEENSFEVELSEELSNKHPTYPMSMIKPYKSSDAETFPLRKKVPQFIPPIETSGIKKITKVLKERKLRTKKVRKYLVRYIDPTCEDEWLAEKDIPETTKLTRRL
ncbi:hypothetical protein O181_084041 [Austropuccinia psidii MF-1]|uniref:Integrase catalytic domain-containing protein n=1 Tax=Austropuccinia psidii MF-1 TaxID=1389203 RepID=A0A9Q3FVR0_9BASI|nr:hypothetical protein [Austropuccinia psidii MF-1]